VTKAIGTGVLSTALKKDRAAAADFERGDCLHDAVECAASEALQEVQEKAGTTQVIHAVTDITGFGLLGHAREMALGSPEQGMEAVSLEIEAFGRFLPPRRRRSGPRRLSSGGLKNNSDFIGDCVGFAKSVPQEYRNCSSTRKLPVACWSPSRRIRRRGRRRSRSPRDHPPPIGKVISKTNPLLFVR